MVYETPKSILQENINKILKEPTDESILEDLIRLCLFKDASKDESLLVIPAIFDLLGSEKFAELITIVDGKTVTFPTKDKLKNMVLLSLAYHLRNDLGMDWDEIKAELNAPDLNTVRLGINLSSFEAWIEERLKKG